MFDVFEQPIRILPDGRGCWLVPIGYGKMRLGVGALNSSSFDDLW
jgi:hypothetical protein